MNDLHTDLAKLSWPDAQALIAEGCIAILPVGATEAHGPHLPLDTDVTIALGMSRRAALKLRAQGHPCVVLPSVSYSVTDFAASFSGSMSLPSETAEAHLTAILASAAKNGFKTLAVANGHLEPAHIGSIKGAVAAVAAASGCPIAFADVTRRRLAERLTEEFQSGACHAGRYESSLVMADDPDSVKDDVRLALPPVEISLVDAMIAGQSDFVAAGGTQAYFGWPADASAAEGQATFGILAELLVEAILAAAESPPK
ncbi:MAG: creatinine amidohydrolase [Pseudohongiellaceae bacterium]|jgi:creatinine amidohydrolase